MKLLRLSHGVNGLVVLVTSEFIITFIININFEGECCPCGGVQETRQICLHVKCDSQ